MVAYNFQIDFAPGILSGRKLSTIRPDGIRLDGKRRHAVAGDELQLYVGMRTPSCRLLLRVPCLWSRPIEIHHWGVREGFATEVPAPSTEHLAQIEGFTSFANMQAWFDNRYGLPAVGFTQIRWDFAAATFHAERVETGGSAP